MDRSAGRRSLLTKLLVLFTVGFFLNIVLQLVHTSGPATASSNKSCPACAECPACPTRASCPPCPSPSAFQAAAEVPSPRAAAPSPALPPRVVSANLHVARATQHPALAERLERYMRLQEAFTAGRPFEGKEPKFVHCAPRNQMGNRVRFIVPCFMFALLTDRALMVDFKTGFQASVSDLFDVPFPMEAHSMRQPRGSRRHVSFPTDNEVFTCRDPREAFSSAETVSFEGAYYFVPHLLYNPWLREEIRTLFPDGKVAEPASLFLMYPRQEVWDIVKDVQEKFLSDASFVVGIQMRNNKPPAEKDWISDKEFEMVQKCALELTPPHLRDRSKWFIAADAGRAIGMCQEKMDPEKTVLRWKPSEFVLSSGPAELREAVADVMLLAVSDAMIMSPWSSYGQMAQVYHRQPSYWVSDFVQPEGHDYGLYKEISEGCFKLATTEYSVGEWSDWSSKLSCFHRSMLGDHWL